MENNFVMKSSAKDRVRMANQRSMVGLARSRVEQGFEASSGTVDEERADGGGGVR